MSKYIRQAITKVNTLENARRLGRDWELKATEDFFQLAGRLGSDIGSS